MSRLPGLNDDEVTELIVSVGTHQKNRHASPAGVARLFQLAVDAGANPIEIARVVSINDTMVRRFLMLGTLPASVRDLVRWGRPKGGISMTVAGHIARLGSSEDQKQTTSAAIEFGLSGSEVIQIAQTRQRSGKPIGDCIDAALNLRPVIERQYLYIGLVRDRIVRNRIRKLSADDRQALAHPLLNSISSEFEGSLQLGENSFSILASAELAPLVDDLKPDFESAINELLGAKVE